MFPSTSLKFLLVGAAALVTMASARPVEVARDITLPVLSNVVNADVDVNVLPEIGATIEGLEDRDCPLTLPAGTDSAATPAPTEPATPVEPEVPTAPEEPTTPEPPVPVPAVLLNLQADLGPVLGEIKATIKAGKGIGAELDVELVEKLLGDVTTLVSGALGDIRACLQELPIGEALGLAGDVLGALDLCGLLAGLLNTLLAVLFTVLSALKGLENPGDIPALLNGVIVTVAQIVGIVINGVPPVQGLLAPIVKTLIAVLGGLGLNVSPLLQVLGL